jgi:hypothetical protein
VDSTLIRNSSKDLFEPLESPDVAIAGGGFAEAQHRRGFGVAQLLEVPQGGSRRWFVSDSTDDCMAAPKRKLIGNYGQRSTLAVTAEGGFE